MEKNSMKLKASEEVALVVIWENAQMSEQFLQWTVPLMHLLIEETLDNILKEIWHLRCKLFPNISELTIFF